MSETEGSVDKQREEEAEVEQLETTPVRQTTPQTWR